jgi:multisubunit Na+/H+ antiporter MnhB subunit
VSTQLNYALATPQCLRNVYPVPWLAMVLALMALAGAGLSLLAYRHSQGEPAETERKPRTEVFLSLLGLGLGVLFATVILLQAYAGMVFTGCER